MAYDDSAGLPAMNTLVRFIRDKRALRIACAYSPLCAWRSHASERQLARKQKLVR